MFHFPDLDYACIHCGRSCHSFEVRLDPGQRLEGAEVDARGRKILACLSQGCPHLSSQSHNRCQVFERQPSACRHFPFAARTTPGGTFVGASFACSSILQTLSGPSASAERAWQANNWSEWPLQGSLEVDLLSGQPCSWATYLEIEEQVLALLEEETGLFQAAFSLSLTLKGQQPPLQWLDPQLGDTCLRVLRGLVALGESDRQPQRATQVVEAFLQGGTYLSQIFPGLADPQRLSSLMEAPDPEHWLLVRGFFHHLIWRKFLWGGPSLHARVCLLPLLNQLLRYWNWQQATAVGTAPTLGQRQEAIRELERRVTFHAQGWEDFVAPLSQAFLQGCGGY